MTSYNDVDWTRAACANEGDQFYVPRTNRQLAACLTICASCPIKLDCGDYALDTGQRFGIWGGMTEDDRRAIRRQNREAADVS